MRIFLKDNTLITWSLKNLPDLKTKRLSIELGMNADKIAYFSAKNLPYSAEKIENNKTFLPHSFCFYGAQVPDTANFH